MEGPHKATRDALMKTMMTSGDLRVTLSLLFPTHATLHNCDKSSLVFFAALSAH